MAVVDPARLIARTLKSWLIALAEARCDRGRPDSHCDAAGTARTCAGAGRICGGRGAGYSAGISQADGILWRAASALADLHLRGSSVSAAGGERGRRNSSTLRAE